MTQVFVWNKRDIPFIAGESVASALSRAGIADLGPGPGGGRATVFCGIGQCQSCLIVFGGCRVEACLLPARVNMHFLDGKEVEP